MSSIRRIYWYASRNSANPRLLRLLLVRRLRTWHYPSTKREALAIVVAMSILRPTPATLTISCLIVSVSWRGAKNATNTSGAYYIKAFSAKVGFYFSFYYILLLIFNIHHSRWSTLVYSILWSHILD